MRTRKPWQILKEKGGSLVAYCLGLQAFTPERLGSAPSQGTKILWAMGTVKKRKEKGDYFQWIENPVSTIYNSFPIMCSKVTNQKVS